MNQIQLAMTILDLIDLSIKTCFMKKEKQAFSSYRPLPNKMRGRRQGTHAAFSVATARFIQHPCIGKANIEVRIIHLT